MGKDELSQLKLFDMNTLQNDFYSLFERDLNALIKNVEAIPEDELWEVSAGVTNSVGVLAQHLVGNLNHFIGQGIRETGYVRQRDREFTNAGQSKQELIADIERLKVTLADTFTNLDDSLLSQKYPMESPFDMPIQKVLIHLYGHLNYHLGQVNYLRRILSENG